MFNKNQFIEIVKNVLTTMNDVLPGLYSDEAVTLLVLTCAQESGGGYYFKQIKGPARGFFQMEPETEDWILKWLQANNKVLYNAVISLTIGDSDFPSMIYSIAYQIAMCRMRYYLAPGKIPTDINGIAGYWKQY